MAQLPKTLKYLESKLKAPSVQSDAYQSWLSYPLGTLVNRCKEFGIELTPETIDLMESLEELEIHLTHLNKLEMILTHLNKSE